MMKIVKIFGPRGLGPQFGIFGIVMMKIVKIFGRRWRGPPISDIWDSYDEDT